MGKTGVSGLSSLCPGTERAGDPGFAWRQRMQAKVLVSAGVEWAGISSACNAAWHAQIGTMREGRRPILSYPRSDRQGACGDVDEVSLGSFTGYILRHNKIPFIGSYVWQTITRSY